MAQRKTLYIGVAVLAIVIAAALAYYYFAVVMVPPPPAEPIKMGIVAPLTGPVARTGKELQDGIRFAYDDLKAEGKIPVEIDGVLRDIELVWIDSKSDPEEAVKAYEDAIVRLGVDVLGWNWHSSVAMALYKISTKYGKVHFGSVGETQFLCQARLEDPEASKYWFKSWACPPLYASLFAPAIEDVMKDIGYTPRNRIAALIVEETDYGRGMGDALKEALEEYGWTVVHYDVFSLSPPETEFTPLISKYKTADASLVYLVSTGLPSMNAFLKQAYEMKLKALKAVFGVGWFSPDEWYEPLKEASDYIVAMDTRPVMTDEQREWISRFEEKYGYEPSSIVAGFWGYDFFSMYVEGLNRAGTLDAEKLKRALLDMEYKGIFMTIKYAEEPIPGKAHYMEIIADREHFFLPLVQWKGGEYKILWPPEVATGKLEIPPELKE
jgi:branched-chain amino acid transport system substrate-binding protein